MLADEIGRGEYEAGSLAAQARDTLDQYAVMMALGSVRNAKLTSDHADAGADGDAGDILAHAYVLLVPKHVVRRMCGDRARVPQRTPPDESLDGVLTLDGTNLKITEERDDFLPHPGSELAGRCVRLLRGVRFHSDRFKAYARPNNRYYIDVVSCMTRGIELPDGRPVYQLYFSRGDVYGVPFADLVRDPSVELTPCVECTREELDAVAYTLSLEPLAPPLDGGPDAEAEVLELVRAGLPGWAPHRHGLRYGAPAAGRGHEAGVLVLTQDDVFAGDIHAALQGLVDGGRAHAVALYPEAFSRTLFGAVVVIHPVM